jgi:hypothetical protein
MDTSQPCPRFLQAEMSEIKTYTTSRFLEKLSEHFQPHPKAIHEFVNIESLKKSIIDVSFIKPLLFVFEKGKVKKFMSCKDLNEKLGHEVLFLNLRKGIEHKLKQLNIHFIHFGYRCSDRDLR